MAGLSDWDHTGIRTDRIILIGTVFWLPGLVLCFYFFSPLHPAARVTLSRWGISSINNTWEDVGCECWCRGDVPQCNSAFLFLSAAALYRRDSWFDYLITHTKKCFSFHRWLKSFTSQGWSAEPFNKSILEKKISWLLLRGNCPPNNRHRHPPVPDLIRNCHYMVVWTESSAVFSSLFHCVLWHFNTGGMMYL